MERPEPPCPNELETREAEAGMRYTAYTVYTAAAKPTYERNVEIMKDRASSMERAPSERYYKFMCSVCPCAGPVCSRPRVSRVSRLPPVSGVFYVPVQRHRGEPGHTRDRHKNLTNQLFT